MCRHSRFPIEANFLVLSGSKLLGFKYMGRGFIFVRVKNRTTVRNTQTCLESGQVRVTFFAVRHEKPGEKTRAIVVWPRGAPRARDLENLLS